MTTFDKREEPFDAEAVLWITPTGREVNTGYNALEGRNKWLDSGAAEAGCAGEHAPD